MNASMEFATTVLKRVFGEHLKSIDGYYILHLEHSTHKSFFVIPDLSRPSAIHRYTLSYGDYASPQRLPIAATDISESLNLWRHGSICL